MSGYSDIISCANCNMESTINGETRPFPMSYVECLECGFYSTVETGQMTTQEINEEREDRSLEPLADDHVIEPIGEGLKMGRRYWQYAAHHLEYQDVLELREDKGLEPWTDIQAREFLSKVGEQIKETVSVAYQEALDMMIYREEDN